MPKHNIHITFDNLGSQAHKQSLTISIRVKLVSISTDNPPSLIHFNLLKKLYVNKNEIKLFAKKGLSVDIPDLFDPGDLS